MPGIKAGLRRVILASVILLSGCTSWAEEFANQAAALHLKRKVITGSRFQHVVYRNTLDAASTKTLHVYFDGDGTTWTEDRPADDPTPRNPMVLRLMAQDNTPAVYVGRPCYHGATAKGDCSSRYWSKDRYSEDVVDSLAAVVKQLLASGGYRRVAWFGHSGGGTLAVLLAARFPQTSSVVSIAANLDIDAWSVYSGYHDLGGSLNPACLPPLSPFIRQFHYAGANDKTVPPALMAKAAEHLGSRLIVVDAYDHVCCWEHDWPVILEKLSK